MAAVLSDGATDASVLRFSEIRAFLRSGDLEGGCCVVVDCCCSASWEQSTPSVVASTMTPPSSALGVGQGWLKSSAEAPGDGVTGLKSSGVLEETDGGVWACLGGVSSRLVADWMPYLPLRSNA